MIFCLVVIGICLVLGCVCKIALVADEVKLGTMAETFFSSGELTLMKKIFICVIMLAFCLFSVAAYADETEAEAETTPAPTMDVIPSLIDEEDSYVADTDDTEESDPVSDAEDDTEASGDDDSDDPSVSDPDDSSGSDPEPTFATASATGSVDQFLSLQAGEESPASYEEQTLQVLGSIQAYLLFFVVVILLYFSYKFLRMFF